MFPHTHYAYVDKYGNGFTTEMIPHPGSIGDLASQIDPTTGAWLGGPDLGDDPVHRPGRDYGGCEAALHLGAVAQLDVRRPEHGAVLCAAGRGGRLSERVRDRAG